MQGNAITLAVLIVLALVLVIYSLLPKKRDDRDVVKRRLAGRRGTDEEAEIRARARASAADDLVKKATPVLSRIIMPTSDQEQTNLRVKLANAGYRQPQAQTLFLASKSIVAVVGIVLGVVAGIASGLSPAMIAGAGAFGAGAGMMLPGLWLSMAASGRKAKVRDGLPDSLDLLVVSVEAGLALDAAFKRVGEEMAAVHPELSEELRIATMESQMGLPRNEALSNMARRTGLDEVRSLVTVIVQAEKFGTSVARALRNQAESLRTKRRQKAEEKAQKTAVKLMIPLVMFIFPAMFVVLGGPAAINIMKALKDNPQLAGG
jgi:tight adherence protein C